MKDTACENCPFRKMGFDECPNYIETLWHEQGSAQPTIVHDCAPRRSLLMVQELYNRTFGMQQQINQAETEMGQVRGSLNLLIEALRYMEKHIDKDVKTRYVRHLQSMKTDGEVYKRVEEQ